LKALLIFAKAPIPGLVKTRLARELGLTGAEAAELYTGFLADTLELAVLSEAERLCLSYYPQGGRGEVTAVVERTLGSGWEGRITIFEQRGSDFDERFTRSVEEGLEGSSHLAVIGSDIPHLQPGAINRAFEILAAKDGMVVGPAREGGAYLIGLSRALDFTGVFTSGVELENLSALAARERMALHLLPETSDIDVAADLVSMLSLARAMRYASNFQDLHLPRHTLEAISKLGLRITGAGDGGRGRVINRAEP